MLSELDKVKLLEADLLYAKFAGHLTNISYRLQIIDIIKRILDELDKQGGEINERPMQAYATIEWTKD